MYNAKIFKCLYRQFVILEHAYNICNECEQGVQIKLKQMQFEIYFSEMDTHLFLNQLHDVELLFIFDIVFYNCVDI